jgi:hypothetical protein
MGQPEFRDELNSLVFVVEPYDQTSQLGRANWKKQGVLSLAALYLSRLDEEVVDEKGKNQIR